MNHYFIYKKPFKRIVGFFLLLLLCAVCVLSFAFYACSNPYSELQGKTMGTVYSVKMKANGNATTSEIAEKIEELLAHFNKVFSTYDPSSEISKINAAFKKANERSELNKQEYRRTKTITVNVSKRFYLQLSSAIAVAKQTRGAFDPTVKPLVDLWGFSKKENPEAIPSKQAIASKLEIIGYKKVKLESNGKKFFLTAPIGFAFDFSAIAKGKAVDEIAQLLEGYGITNYLIDIGGEIAMRGKNKEGSYYKIGVATPNINEAFTATKGVVVSATNSRLGVATSGDYLNYFEKNGVRYSHLLNATTGMPITHNLASVTVLAPTAEAADAFATGIFIMGEKKGIAFAKQFSIPAMFIFKQTDEYGKRTFKTHTNVFFQKHMQSILN